MSSIATVRKMLCLSLATCFLLFLQSAAAQGVGPYPNAITDRLVYQETPMTPPPVNVVFNDPDLGSPMVRVTDQTTDYIHATGYLRNAALGEANEWSADASKFYVIGPGGDEFAFGFTPSTMAVSSLPGA